jgi:hypothetical protein
MNFRLDNFLNFLGQGQVTGQVKSLRCFCILLFGACPDCPGCPAFFNYIYIIKKCVPIFEEKFFPIYVILFFRDNWDNRGLVSNNKAFPVPIYIYCFGTTGTGEIKGVKMTDKEVFDELIAWIYRKFPKFHMYYFEL